MKITRENYEAWLLDYTEGNLTEDQRADLLIFLSQHPDLEADFEVEATAVLAPYRADGQLPDRATLYIDEGFSSQDEWLAAVAEGDVVGALADAARTDAALGAKLAQFEKLRLKPDTAYSFTDKAALRRGAVVVPLYATVLRFVAAAAVFVFVFGGAWLLLNQAPTAQLAANTASDLRIARTPSSVDQAVQAPTETNGAVGGSSERRGIQRVDSGAATSPAKQPNGPRIEQLQPRSAEGIAMTGADRAPLTVVIEVPEVVVREDLALVEELEGGTESNQQPASPEFTVSEYLMHQAQTRVLGGVQSTETNLSRVVFDRAVEKISTASSGELAYVAPSAEQPRSFRLKLGKFEIER